MADTAYSLTEETLELPASFRKLTARQKRTVLNDLLELDLHELHCSNPSEELLDLADVMVESAVGVMPVPLGIATGFRIDDSIVNIKSGLSIVVLTLFTIPFVLWRARKRRIKTVTDAL